MNNWKMTKKLKKTAIKEEKLQEERENKGWWKPMENLFSWDLERVPFLDRGGFKSTASVYIYWKIKGMTC